MSNRHFYVVGFIFMLWVEMFLVHSAIGHLPQEADFRQLYAAGAMVRMGQGAAIYDQATLGQFEDRFVSRAQGILPFNHLAYETLFYFPVSGLRYRTAYLLMVVANLSLLGVLLWIFQRKLGSVAWLLIGFLPFAITVIQSQDSIILAVCFALAGIGLENANDRLAGLALAVGLFKFQFVLPVVLLFAAWRQWKLVGWFGVGSLTVGTASLAVTGWRPVAAYVHSLLAMSSGLSKATEDVYGIYPLLMPNIRGLVCSLGGGTAITVILSLTVLAWAATRTPSFELAIIAAVLVSYHCLHHDLSILAVGLVGLMKSRQWLAVMFLVPSVAFSFGMPFCVVGVPILGLVYYAGERRELGYLQEKFTTSGLNCLDS